MEAMCSSRTSVDTLNGLHGVISQKMVLFTRDLMSDWEKIQVVNMNMTIFNAGHECGHGLRLV
jgi:hypothetical protein